MKQISLKVLFILMALTLLLAGCASKPEPAPPPPPPAPAPPPEPVGPISEDPLGDLKKGGIALECREYEVAIDLLSGVINAGGISDWDMAKAYNLRGLAYTWLKDCDNALADYSQAIELWPKYGAAYYNRGFTWMKCGDNAKANEDMAMAARYGYTNPGNKVRTWCPKF